MKRTILVTGGAGFIGANLVHELVTLDDTTVHVLAEPGSNYWRLATILEKITVHEVSITNHAAIRQLVLSLRPHEIYHLAAYGGMPDQQDQAAVFAVNLYGTIHLLNVCKEVGFDVFINTGSSSEYGKKNIPMAESMPLEPVSDYAVAKIAATHFCLKEALVHKLPIYTVRPFSVYGDYEMPTRLIPTIISHALQKKTMSLASPHNVRDYIYIKDMTALYHTIAKQKPTTALVFNGGSGIQSSTDDVVNAVEKITQTPLTIQWGQAASRPWEPTHWQADISLAKTVLNWQPQYRLQQGLSASLAWFENNLYLYDNQITHTPPLPSQPKLELP